jgi:hypothetical protein
MNRIVVLGQPGTYGDAWRQHTAARLAQQLDVPRIDSADVPASAEHSPGWVATAVVGALSSPLLRSADTAIWLNFLPTALTRAWVKGLQAKLGGAVCMAHVPCLADVRDSLMHMAWTPHVHRLLSHSALAHLQVFHLRSPEEAAFWLRAQEHRVPLRLRAAAHPA